jgi:hypothetical protein
MVNTKMKAIADKIRSILGITGKMGLDAMASNLETEQSNIAAAFTSIESKGGAVPESKVSGNLASAILGIPEGAEIKRTTGTFSAKGGSVTVDCGFAPDLFYFTTSGTEKGYLMTGCIAFEAANQTKLNTTTWDIQENIIDAFATRSENGVSISMITYDSTWDEINYPGTFSYVAVKYT